MESQSSDCGRIMSGQVNMMLWMRVEGMCVNYFFFFQAEDGIRDISV